MSIVMCEKEKHEGFAANGWLVLSIEEIAYPETNSKAIIQQESLEECAAGQTQSSLGLAEPMNGVVAHIQACREAQRAKGWLATQPAADTTRERAQRKRHTYTQHTSKAQR